jgi:hypothetical protein
MLEPEIFKLGALKSLQTTILGINKNLKLLFFIPLAWVLFY